MRLLTWNIQWGRGADGRVDLARTVAAIRAAGEVDVICLQEVACNFPGLAGGVREDEPAKREVPRERAAEEQVEVFEKRLLGEIEAEIENGLTQYRLGRIEAYALLDLFRSLAEARLEHLQARYLYAVALAGMDAAGEDGE